MDTSAHNEIFYSAFDKLLALQFGEFSRIIYFYLYERRNIDGSINNIKDDQGVLIKLENANDLWELISRMKPLAE